MPELNLPTEARQIDTNTKVTDVQTKTSTINTNVGSNADGSSATGSVHAKLKDIKSAITSVPTSVIKSIQRGTVYIPQTPNDTTVAISAVVPAKCLVTIEGMTGYNGYEFSAYIVSLSSTVLSVNAGNPNAVGTISWQVVEFY